MALRQAKFQFYANDGTESTSTPLAGIGVGISKEDGDQSTFLIRFLIQSDASTVGSNTVAQFERNLNGGAWGPITTTSTIVKAVTTTVFADIADTTQRLAGTGAFDTNNDGCTHDGTAGGAQMDIAANGNNETICACQIVAADVVPTDVVGIRITTTPTAITVWDQNATVTITTPVVNFTANPTTGALTITGQAPAVTADASVGLGLGVVTVVGFAPTVSTTADITAEPSVGSITVTGFAPDVPQGLTERLTPNAVLAGGTNLRDTLSNNPPTRFADIDEPTGSDDGEWWTAVDPNSGIDIRLGFPPPSGNLVAMQTINARIRGTSLPSRNVRLALWENGARRSAENTDAVSSVSGQIITLTFDQSSLTGNDAQIQISAGLVLLDRTVGTNIGDMTTNGGLAAAFDGTTNQAQAACAAKGTGSNFAYIGKTLAAPAAFGRAIVYGSNANGFWGSANPTTNLNIYGKQGAAPSTSTDGTIVGTISFTDTADESAGRQIQSTDTATAWDHIWVRIDSGGTSTAAKFIAELVLYEWV